MDYGHIPGIDKPISRLVQGTTMIENSGLPGCLELLDEIYAAGCTAFDTAQSYNRGESERLLGRWINERGLRDQVVVITKGAHPNADRNRVTPFDITADLHDSLARLKIDCIDLYLLHRDDPEIPVGTLVEVLNEHLAAGRIRAFGGSNWTHDRLEAANEYAAAHNLKPFVASSPNFSLAVRMQEPWPGCLTITGEDSRAAREWYARTQMPLIFWSSLAGGFFSGRFRRDNLATFDSTRDRVCATAYGYEENFQRLDRAQALAAEKGLTAAQIALAYVLNQPWNVFALVGCNTGAEFRENAAALDVSLTSGEIAWLELRADIR